MLREIKGKFSQMCMLPQLQLVGDRLMVFYRYTLGEKSDDKLPNCRGPCQGIESTSASIASANEGPRHVMWEPVKNGSYAKVTSE